MIYRVDAKVLLRFLRTADVSFPIVRSAVRELWTNGYELKTTSQNLTEFWNASTRPIDRNSYGLEASKAN